MALQTWDGVKVWDEFVLIDTRLSPLSGFKNGDIVRIMSPNPYGGNTYGWRVHQVNRPSVLIGYVYHPYQLKRITYESNKEALSLLLRNEED